MTQWLPYDQTNAQSTQSTQWTKCRWIKPQRANQKATHTSESQRGWVHPLMECSLQCKAGTPVFDGLRTKHCTGSLYWILAASWCVCLLQYLSRPLYCCSSTSGEWDRLIDWASMLWHIWHLKTICSTAICLRSHAQYASGQTRKSPDIWPCPAGCCGGAWADICCHS